jgi:hypothetical protein
MKRILFAGLVLLVVGCGGGGGSWTCNWQCTTNDTHGTKTYPAGPDPTDQCTADFGISCNSFSCSCTQ